MNKLNALLIVLTILFSANSYSQKTNNFSDWLYFKSDKPVQFRLNKTKLAGNKIYYKIEMKLDKNSPVYSANEYRYGYVIYLSVHQYDWETKKGSNKEFQFMMTNDYDGVYVINDEFYSVKEAEDDKFISFWDTEKCYPMTKNKISGEISKLSFSYSCVDTKLKNREYNDICNNKGFKANEAIEIK